MSEINKRYFTTSEMANISGVTKHTLFHYDEIGLLKPEFVHTNGYRYYSLRQSYILDMISVLKKAGSSLREIKGFLQDRSGSTLVELFKSKQQELEAELLRVKRMQDLLQNAILMTEKPMEPLRSEPSLEECETEYLVATPLELGSDEEFNTKLSEHRSYCEEHLINHEFPVWAIWSKETFESGSFLWGYVANKIKAPIKGDRMLTKPKGLYVVMDFTGSYESIMLAAPILKEFIERNGLKVDGDVYTMDLINYFSEADFDSYIIRIWIQVSA
ncbi:MerR family transcriptional regulator [Paenibacillus pasadenensis]|uniref:MerR family transcriptional regulator n=1 Tax=Paenibacillus pasadenensis TaxID=217090 RepID=UPI00203AD79B|nr:MerR family transcriptional regulator [Paenibacillus pasadenensis]MCM3749498.1 MerR family transcriptional regulator [Paenibacillus pasadenensis]